MPVTSACRHRPHGSQDVVRAPRGGSRVALSVPVPIDAHDDFARCFFALELQCVGRGIDTTRERPGAHRGGLRIERLTQPIELLARERQATPLGS
jgi:hypothetical protein